MDFKSFNKLSTTIYYYFQVMDAETQRQLSEKEHQRSAAVFAAAKQKVKYLSDNNNWFQELIVIFCFSFNI